ncbi:MAG: hypothetical protein CMJ64_01580 [Planctomycetaceae bacterium]|nr:hypothetical protein [Planctomycetaceae bacterium]
MIEIALAYTLLALGLLGHLALWVALFNRVHALGIPRRLIKATEMMQILAVVAMPVAWCWRLAMSGQVARPLSRLSAGHFVDAVYFAIACGMLVYVASRWSWRRFHEKPPSGVLASTTVRYDVARELSVPLVAGMTSKLLSLVPENEVTALTVSEKEFELARLDEGLDGLSILHLSDLHFTGKIERAYFDFVIDRVNDIEADLVVVTGDIIDKERCLDWIAPTLGRLRARHSKYFILGNHDKRVRDVAALRRRVTDCGFIDLGGRCNVITVDGRQVLLAGNELPWFGPAPFVPSRAELEDNSGVLRILLSHSPDQLSWARSNDFDLMLAGHTHGGQIRLPMIGPIVAPSHFGVKYASGTFYERPTLLHVSRGISGLEPIRINCPPEVTRVVLRSASSRIAPPTSRSEDARELAESF